ncbi:MAG: hypothetical protein HY078_05520 [Elusimicrobia bacterium]|nr:hypothetical protein [Elusimicrobiota bacterium]
MTRLLRVLLSLLLLPQFAGALSPAPALQNIDVVDIRSGALTGVSPAPALPQGQIVPIDFRVRRSDNPPTNARQLTDDQLNTFSRRIYAIDRQLNGGTPTLKREIGKNDPLVEWVRQVLRDYDQVYSDVNPDNHGPRYITTAQWDRILDAMAAKAELEYPKSRNWQTAFTEMLRHPFRERLIDDPHSAYHSQAEYAQVQSQMRGQNAGIGCQIELDVIPAGAEDDEEKAEQEEAATPPKEPTMTRGAKATCYPGSGAEAAGVQDDDVLSAVYQVRDGVETRVPFAGKTLTFVSSNLLGTPGTKVKVEIVRNGRVVSPDPVITRSVFSIPTVLAKMLTGTKIAYVHFTGFDQNAARLVKQALQRMISQDKAEAIIVDVRRNPGGLVDTAAQLTSEFLKNGQDIFSYARHERRESTHVTVGDGPFSDIPLAILINGGSASASEILAQAIQDHKCAGQPACSVIIGSSNTFGKGSRQSIHPYPEGFMGIGGGQNGAARITEGEWRGPNFRNVNAKRDERGREIPGTGGIAPNVLVQVDKKHEAQVMQARGKELLLRSRDASRNVPQASSAVKDYESLIHDAVLERAKAVLSPNRG